jgi:hypothetical protein
MINIEINLNKEKKIDPIYSSFYKTLRRDKFLKRAN